MGGNRRRGIGGGGSNAQAAPTAPGNGSGGPGVLMGGTANVSAAAGDEITDLMAGRITLGLVNITILALIGFYIWTRSAQGGG